MTSRDLISRTDTASSNSSHFFRKRSSSSSGRAVWLWRFLFILTLCGAAAALGALAHYFTATSESDLAERQFESISDRALTEASGIARQKRLAVLTMASMVGMLLPNATEWPFVAIQGFEQTANHLLNATSGEDMGFIPFVEPSQLAEWEDYAYDFYYRQRKPPFPNTTAVSSFGRGVWGINPALNTKDQRYHDTNGTTNYGSPYQILTPVFHVDEGANRVLLFNQHSTALRGKQIDSIIDCVKRNTNEGTLQDSTCGTVTEMLTILKFQTRGPGAVMYQPIFPANSPTSLVGLIPTSVIWDEILENIFAQTVSGVDCVVSSTGQDFTYQVTKGIAYPRGEGDLHETPKEGFRRCRQLTDPDLFTENSTSYQLCLYPTDEFFEGFSTSNPEAATIGAVLIIVFTSLLFFVYDFAVRREFHVNKELLEAKRRFMRFVSHEVRTPLNAVCMGLTVIQTEIAASLGYKSAEDLELRVDEAARVVAGRPGEEKSLEWFTLAHEVRTSAVSAVDVLSDLLNYDKIENGQLQLELTVIRIWRLIERTANEFRLPATKKCLQLALDFTDVMAEKDIEQSITSPASETLTEEAQDMKVVGDAVRLTQVLRNLLSNALKFTPEGGSVTVKASWCRSCRGGDEGALKSFELKNGDSVSFPERGELRVSVEDSGAGMSTEQLARLFRDGVQFNVNELQAGQGSGLGLYITKGIVEQHDGTLEATSAGLGKGTTFTMSLPLYRVPDEKEGSSAKAVSTGLGSANTPESESMRILVVDDVSSNRKLLGRLLKNRGHAYDEAEDGQVAVDMVASAISEGSRYDTLLLDFEMPRMDGPTAAKEVRSMGCDVFIVGVTGNLLPEDVSHFMSCGANAVLPKPFTISDLEDLWVEYGVVAASTDQAGNDHGA